MFYPEAMTEIELVVPAKDLLAVTKILSGKGTFHQIDASYLTSEKGIALPNTWQDKTTAYSSLERRIQVIMQTLGMSEGTGPKTEFEEMTDLETCLPLIETLEAEVKRISDQLLNETKNLEQIDGTLNQLEPIKDIELDISQLRNQRYLYSTLGIIPVNNIARLQDSLSRVPFFFLLLREDNQKAVVWLAGARANIEILERAIRSSYLIPLALPDGHQGMPAEIIKDLLKHKEECHATISQLKNELAKIKDQRSQLLQTSYWDVHASRIMADAILRFGRLKYTYLIVGWTPASSLSDLSQRLKAASKEVLIEAFPTKRGSGQQDVPVNLKHSAFFDPFKMLVTTYALPRYNEFDPTILIMITFPLLYGAMFGDVGQGMVLALLGWLLMSRKVNALKSMAGLGGLITACGLMAAVFGFVYGSVFGVESLLHPLWIHPLENIFLILEVAIGAGVVLLSIGFILGVVNAISAKNWGQLFFERSGLPGLLLYWSLIGLAAGALLKITLLPSFIFIILAIYGAVAIMFSEVFKHLLEGHRPLINDSIGTFAIQAFFELFETFISLLSNSLSYVRIGAFAVGHGGLSLAFFNLGGLIDPGHGVGYIIVVIIGNIFIIGFEGLIVGIQTMRLEYYEFFSKFFVGGGKRYEPLTLRPVGDK